MKHCRTGVNFKPDFCYIEYHTSDLIPIHTSKKAVTMIKGPVPYRFVWTGLAKCGVLLLFPIHKTVLMFETLLSFLK